MLTPRSGDTNPGRVHFPCSLQERLEQGPIHVFGKQSSSLTGKDEHEKAQAIKTHTGGSYGDVGSCLWDTHSKWCLSTGESS